MSQYLEHLTLSTGHLSRCTREDLSDAVMDLATAWLERAVHDLGRPVQAPDDDQEPLALTVEVQGPILLATLSAKVDARTAAIADKGAHPWAPLVTLGVPKRATAGPRLWSLLLEADPAARRHILHRPAWPWAATVIHPVRSTDLRYLPTVGAVSGAIAWAWIERRQSLR